MLTALTVSVVCLWVVVLILIFALFTLSRQIGILYERVSPMGALVLSGGLNVGEAVPHMELSPLDDAPTIHLGQPSAKSVLLFFLSPSCPVCKKLLPIIKVIHRAEAAWLDLVLVSDGDDGHAALRQRAGLSQVPYVVSAEVTIAFGVGKLPYAVLIDETAHVRAKGLVNSREQLESLFTAKDAGVASVQEYIDRGRQDAAKSASGRS